MRAPKSLRVFFLLLMLITIASFFLLKLNAETTTAPSLALENLAIAESIGKVQERFNGTGPRMIIQIQDVHAHATAQENIAAILEHLQVAGGIDKVALEGAWATTNLPKSQALATSREKQLLARSLLSDDLISGPVYSAILAPAPLALVGMEDQGLYEQNRKIYLEHLEKIQSIDAKISAYHEQLRASQKTAWNSELLAFGNAYEKFEETSDLGKFFPVLMKISAARSIDISDLSQIVLTQEIMTLEKSVSKERLEKEAKQLMKDFKDNPWTLEELIRGNKIPPERLGFYPEIKKLMSLLKMRDKISLADLVTQVETLITRILTKLAGTPEEKSLWDQCERFYLAKRILLLKATPSDLKAYEEEKAALSAEIQKAGLPEALALSLDFYSIVKKRDDIFFEKILHDPNLDGPLAVVTGGFHTDGLSQKFRAAGISYITISPDLGTEPADEKIYIQRMRENRDFETRSSQNGGKQKMGGSKASSSPVIRHPKNIPTNDQTLSELQNILAWVDNRFIAAYEILLQTKDVRKALAAFLGKAVTVTPTSRVRRLSASGKVLRGQRPDSITASEIRETEFMSLPREAQLDTMRGWLAIAPEDRQKAMLVSSVNAIKNLILSAVHPETQEQKTLELIEQITKNGDVLALLEDVPFAEAPEFLMSLHGLERFDTADFDSLFHKTPRFQRLAKRYPFAIMKNGFQSDRYVVLPEDRTSLVLYRIITLNPSLYRSAKNPAFLALLRDLVSEILSQELPKKAA